MASAYNVLDEWAQRRAREVLKHDPADYGGRQFTSLGDSEIAQRLCVAKGCGEMAYTQSGLMDATTPGELRIFVMCRGHLLATTMAVMSVLGDPNAIDHLSNLATQVGFDLIDLARMSMPMVVPPKDFRCADCGGGQLAAESQGMFKGKRWVHTCGLTVAEASKLPGADLIAMPANGGDFGVPGTGRLHTWSCTADKDHEGACPEPDGEAPPQPLKQLSDPEPVRTDYCGPDCNPTHTRGVNCVFHGMSKTVNP